MIDWLFHATCKSDITAKNKTELTQHIWAQCFADNSQKGLHVMQLSTKDAIYHLTISCVSNISIFSSLIKDLTKCAISSKSLVCNLISCLTTLFFLFQVFPFTIASFCTLVQNLFLLWYPNCSFHAGNHLLMVKYCH